jgi:hypothetical protein
MIVCLELKNIKIQPLYLMFKKKKKKELEGRGE